jgi:anti-anti-sigma factor
MTRRPPQRFEVVDVQLQRVPAVAVRGEVDMAAVPALELALDGAIRDSAGRFVRAFVLDLREVEFLDSSGLHLILRARALLARDDRALAIVCPSGPVRRLFEEAGIADLLVLYDSPEEVATALVPVPVPAD